MCNNQLISRAIPQVPHVRTTETEPQMVQSFYMMQEELVDICGKGSKIFY
ncbi:hypothetical protein [Bacillus spizizenii]|nr:hypothetical protein [Bacillus spizizenii]MEC1527691.1 hypothetical protein [Bacillus spizizenii]